MLRHSRPEAIGGREALAQTAPCGLLRQLFELDVGLCRTRAIAIRPRDVALVIRPDELARRPVAAPLALDRLIGLPVTTVVAVELRLEAQLEHARQQRPAETMLPKD